MNRTFTRTELHNVTTGDLLLLTNPVYQLVTVTKASVVYSKMLDNSTFIVKLNGGGYLDIATMPTILVADADNEALADIPFNGEPRYPSEPFSEQETYGLEGQ